MKLKSKLASIFTAAVMCITMLPKVPSLTSDAASVGQKLSVGNGTTQHKGNCDGYSYEIWLDRTGGSGTMTLGSGATFKAEWSASVPSGNFLARRGLDFGSTKKATSYDYIGMDYTADYRQTGSSSGNSRLCVYGWFQNKGLSGVPLVEYYIIEDWVDWVPDAPGKMVTIDGAQYKIFQMDHSGPSINSSYETFKQYFSVRQSKRKSGHITVSDHFKAWENEGWGIGNLYEVALNAEGWQSSGYADITELDVYTDPDKKPDTPTPTPDPEEEVNYTAPSGSGSGVTDNFEGTGTDWTGRGDVSYGLTSDFAHSGNKSLYVEGRTQSWNGFTISSNDLEAGSSYDISAFAGFKSKNYSSMGFTLGVQYVTTGSDPEYVNLVDATGSSGKWTELAASFDIPSNAKDIALYVQSAYTETASASDLVPFFLDDVKLTKTSTGTTTPDPTPTPSGDSYIGKFGHLFKMGTSVSPNELSSGASFIKKHFNSITPENELKPQLILKQGSTDNTRCIVDISAAARTLKFCEDNNIGVRGHTFVWYSQTPDWFFKENFSSSGAYVSKEIMNKRLENFIKDTFDAIKTQYPKLNLYAYDVCNELFLNDGGGLRKTYNTQNSGASDWAKVYGEDNDEFIINAFTYARKYAPAGCKLYINDYNEYIDAKTNDIYNIAMKLKDLGVIDGIGMQSHLATNYPSASMYETALKKFISTGLEVSITELDIETKGNDSARAQLFEDVFELAVKYADSIPSFTLWGTHDSISWRKDQTPLPFGANYQPKADFDKIMSVKVPEPTTTTTTTTTKKTTTTTTTTTTTSKPNVDADVYGDANCDGTVNLSDAILVMQAIGNPDVYGVKGTDRNRISEQGAANADVNLAGNGLTNADALTIQKYLLKLVSKLPESTQSGSNVSTASTTKKN